MNRYGPWLLALLFVIVWLVLLHFLAVDRCMDSGGAVGSGGMSCETGSSHSVSLFSYASLFDTFLSALLAATPVGLILSITYSSRGRSDTPNT